MHKILLFPNSDNLAAAAALAERLTARGVVCRVTSPFCELTRFPHPELVVREPAEAVRGAQLILCLGGDGTILAASKLSAAAGIPILGINYGHKGFIAALEPDELDVLDRVLAGDYAVEERMMVEAELLRGGKTIHRALGLNEAVVRSAGSHPLSLTVSADGVIISAYSGDGVIVATPTGSTAYSMSAGGPIVEPSAENLILTPICAHALNVKAVVLRHDREVCVVPRPSQSFEAVLSVDGDKPFPLQAGDEVRVRRSARSTRLITGGKRSFYQIVYSKLISF